MQALQTWKTNTINYFKESYFEFRKVVWPTRREIIQHTLVVIVLSIFVALFLGALDLLFAYGIEKLIFLKK